MNEGEAYFDIVWKQFKKNRGAYWSLWMMAPLFLVAICAPLIASNQPLVYRDGSKLLFPWVRALFNPDQVVDFAFNMTLLGLVPWAVVSVVINMLAKERGVPGRRRAGYVAMAFLAILVVLIGLFSVPGVAPANKYRARTFVVEEFQHPDRVGYYVPIPFGDREQNLVARYEGPGYRKPAGQWEKVNDRFPHLLGTDDLGRDVLVRLLYGSRISLTVGFVAVGIYVTIGVVIGALAGYYGGKIDMIISRVIEVILLFPSFFLILTLVALIGPSIYIIMVVIGLTGWPTVARLIRGEILKQRAIEYAAAARALGASHLRIIFRHLLPNSISPALVAAPFGVAGAIVTEAGLSLLGFGVRPPTASWGVLLQLGNGNYHNWWLIVFPSAGIFVAVTVFNLVGSGLRDAMDPKLRM